jgi:predicted nucleotidyltransferase
LLRIMRNYLRIMRMSPTLDALFPETRAKMLAATLLQPERKWYLTELAAFLHTRPSSLQREVNALSKAGILEHWRDGRRVYLKPDTDSPVFADLKSLFEKTAGVVPVLQRELKGFGTRIPVAFLYGSVARSQESSESDVDLMIVGAVGLSDLTAMLRRVERVLGRAVNPTVFSQAEFARRVRGGDHFLTTVLGDAKVFVKGSEDELEAVAGEGRGQGAHHQQTGA